ncbi:hypothetical protein J7438_11865 [Thalassotalea sp. G20_0]|nr:hypothetical protein [Thalassotalea sp. G20_0]
MVNIKSLEQTEWILREPRSGTRMLFELHHIGQYLRQRHLKMELNQTGAIRSMVSSIGISCLSEPCIANELVQGDLVQLTENP